jgi:D-xylose transport system substrate-binding protein
MKLIRFGVILFFLFAVFSACKKQSKSTVGLLIHEIEGHWVQDLEYLKSFAAASDLQLIVKNAEGNEKKQLDQTKELIRNNVDLIIVIAVNQNTAAGIVREAHDARIKVIAYDRVIMNSELDYLITYDYFDIGTRMVEYAHQRKPKGNYVLFWGDHADNTANLMRQAQEEYLKPFIERGEINLIYRTFIEGWEAETAQKKIEKIIDFSDQPIDVVIASNDDIALAVLETYNRLGKKKPEIITGQDASLEACRSIVSEGQNLTIYKSKILMAKEAILMAKNILDNGIISNINGSMNNNRINVPTLFMPPQMVDKSNIDRTVIQDGLYTWEEVYNSN